MSESENKRRYRLLCKHEPTIPHYCQAWWLDTVCRQGIWDVALVVKGDKVFAAMPYYVRKQMGLTLITMPPFTQTLGPWFTELEGSYTTVLTRRMELLTDLIEQLPAFDDFTMGLSPSVTNWLPFYWKGYSQSTSYTYIIPNSANTDALFSEFHSSKRKQIKKGGKHLEIRWNLPAREFYDHHKMTLEKHGAKISYTWDLFSSIYKNGYAHDYARAVYAVEPENGMHAALFFVWDKTRGYALISTIDPDLRKSGSSDLLYYEIIKWLSSSRNVTQFDFEGSMIPSIEASFRYFGTRQTPYFMIRKSNIKARLLRHTGVWLKRHL